MEMTPADAVAKPDATAEAKSSGHGESKSQMLDQDRDGRLYWLWLVFCFSGIMVAFICYGIVMEYATRLLALRGAERGVSANVVIPGVTRTEAWEKLAKSRKVEPDALVSSVSSRVSPMGSMLPSDVGACVSFLCRPEARWITGVSLPVDGGVHLKI